VNDPGAEVQELLRAATVALEIPDHGVGHPIRATGFFVAPGIIATCAHALSDTRAALPDRVVGYLMDGRPIALDTVPEWYLRTEPGGLDLAFLRAVDVPEEVPHVLLSGSLMLRDPMWAYGHPVGTFRAGQSTGFRYQGPSRLRPAGGQWEPHRLHGTPVGGGYSGSPVLNLRTGAVCGMLCTSGEAGSAHMVTADDIIAGCAQVREAQSAPAVNARWLRVLSDAQLADGDWLYPGPRLRAYLDAAVRAAEDHPYPGVVPGVIPPPLTAVYVRQQAETLSAESGDSPEQASADLAKRPAEEILDREEDCVLVGGPGAGKSSLLRTALITLARRWQRGEPGMEIPVHVLASDLTPPRPIPDLIAASVTASLSAVGILKSWPAESFSDAPLHGVRWLVLVDGLDEVLDPVARRRVLDKIAGAGRAESEAPYRFIVASRPLATSEFPAQDAWRAPRYELQPFATGQVSEFAERWFAELRLPRPHQVAADFVIALDRARLTDPARTPLMATMLCQLFAANRDRALPSGRAGAYWEFVDLLRQRQYEDSASGIYAQVQTLLGPYGPAATGPASEVLVSALDLIARLAHHRQEGRDGLAVDLLAGWTEQNRPRHVPEQRWRSFLREILRRSGLLTQRADDFQFIHQTVSEFFAAQRVTTDADLRSLAYDELFGPWESDVWSPPSWDESYSRFLVAGWPAKADLVEPLRRLATDGGLPGCRFIASLVADSALPDPAIAEEAASVLAAVAGNTEVAFAARLASCEVLTQLRDPRGTDLLASLASDSAIYPALRRRAAEGLVRLGDGRGADLLAVLAGRSEPDKAARIWAAESLARLGDPRGGDQLLDIAADPSAIVSVRADAVRMLIQLDVKRIADQFAALLANGLLDDPSIRRGAMLALTRLADKRHADVLAILIADSGVTAEERVEAARVLVEFGDHRGADVLATLAADGTSPASIRLMAAEALVEMNDDQGALSLVELAADPGITESAILWRTDSSIRTRAAKSLARWSSVDLLLDLAARSDGDPDRRYGAAEALSWISQSWHMQALGYLVTDPAAGAAIRLRAGRALMQTGDRRGPDLIAALVSEPILDRFERCEAAWLVAQAKDRRGSLLRQIMLCSDSWHRRLATTALASLARAQAVPLLEALTVDCRAETDSDRHEIITQELSELIFELAQVDPEDLPASAELREIFRYPRHRRDRVTLEEVLSEGWAEESRYRRLADVFDSAAQREFAAVVPRRVLDGFPRRRAAEALAWLGDPRGADILIAVAAHSKVPVHARVDAVSALERLGDHRVADLLVAIVRDEALDTADRITAAVRLALVDEPASVFWLARLASDRSLDAAERHAAADPLTRFTAGTEELVGLAVDSELDEYTRIGAAESLIRLGDDRGLSLLAFLASDLDRAFAARIEAAEALAHVDAVGAVAVLVGLSSDQALDVGSRERAAEALARLSAPDTADRLAALAADSALLIYTRIEVAEVLARLADPVLPPCSPLWLLTTPTTPTRDNGRPTR
jgi:HEAT repeat protein